MIYAFLGDASGTGLGATFTCGLGSSSFRIGVWGLDDSAGQSSNWLGLVKKSYSTYRLVKEAFGGSSDISAILKDANSAANIYAQLNQQFGISPTESHNFAQTAQARRISDWANFVENNKKR